MGAVDGDPESVEIQAGRRRALAEFDVPARRVADPDRLADVGAAGRLHRRVDRLFDLQLGAVGQLGAVPGEELDAVVGVGVVGGADHDARRRVQGAGQVGDRGRRDRPEQHDVRPGRGEPGLQRGFEHVARDPRVLADDDLPAPAAGQHRPGRPAELEDEVHGDRWPADLAADPVGAEVFPGPGHRRAAAVPIRHGDVRRHASARSTFAIGPHTRSTRPGRASGRGALPGHGVIGGGAGNDRGGTLPRRRSVQARGSADGARPGR